MKKTISWMMCAALTLCGACAGKGGTNTDYMEKIMPETEYTIPERSGTVPCNTLSFEIIGGKDVMPIGAWWAPYDTEGKFLNGQKLPDYLGEDRGVEDRYFKLAKDAGINVFTVSPSSVPANLQANLTLLEKCEKYHIGAFVYDTRFNKKSKALLENMSEYLNEYDYASFESAIGVHVLDEPTAEKFDDLAVIYETYDKLGFDDKYLYTNMLPSLYGLRGGNYAGAGNAEIDYETYLRQYLEKVDTKFLSYDYYCIESANTGSVNYPDYFKNLEIVRRLAKEYNMPFWAFALAGGQHEETEFETKPVFPNEAELLWNVNTSLAYGAKSIQYFCFIQPQQFTKTPNGGRDFTRNSMIGAMGNINQWYYYAQKANAQIQAVDHILMNAENLGIIRGGEDAENCINGDIVLNSFRELTGVEGDHYIVGCFDYYGGTALYIMNNSVTEKDNIILTFSDRYGYDIYQRAQKFSVAGEKVELTLEAGEGVLLTLRY